MTQHIDFLKEAHAHSLKRSDEKEDFPSLHQALFRLATIPCLIHLHIVESHNIENKVSLPTMLAKLKPL